MTSLVLCNQPDPGPGDVIQLQNLQLPHAVTDSNCWGDIKEQPALVSVKLWLKAPFNTAADSDKLDNSTLHYGQLAKKIRAASREGQTVQDVKQSMIDQLNGMCGGNLGGTVRRALMAIHLPKASMYGDGVLLEEFEATVGGNEKAVNCAGFTVQNIQTQILLGVNAYERTAKQPVVASITVQDAEARAGLNGPELWNELWGLDKVLVEILQETDFETLETLANHTVQQLRTRMLDAKAPGTSVRLRLEKPRAIAFADAPGVEVWKVIPGHRATKDDCI